MSDEEIIVRSQLIPLHNLRLVLPNTAIAEVISFYKPEPLEDTPEWIMGMLSWRGLKIPLISFEIASQEITPEINRRSRVIVLNTLSGSDLLPFYGVLAQGIPRLMALTNSNILDAPNMEEVPRFVLRQVVVEGHPAVIPDQQAIEHELASLQVRVLQEQDEAV